MSEPTERQQTEWAAKVLAYKRTVLRLAAEPRASAAIRAQADRYRAKGVTLDG